MGQPDLYPFALSPPDHREAALHPRAGARRGVTAFAVVRAAAVPECGAGARPCRGSPSPPISAATARRPPPRPRAATVREVLDRVFGEDPLLRSYILDDQGRLRRHVNVFVGGRMIADRRALSDAVGPRGRDLRSAGAIGGVSACPTACTWRPARACSPSAAPTAAGQAGPPAFLGEPVTAVLTDPRDGAVYAALRLGHFGCKLHRSDDGGQTWQELPAPAYPAAPEAEAEAPALDMIWTLAAGGADAPGEIWAGTLPGGLFRQPRPRRELGARRGALVEARARRMVRRRLRPPGHPLDPRRPARPGPADRGRLLRRGLEERRPRRELAAGRQGAARRLHAARARLRPQHPGPAPHRRLRRPTRTWSGASTTTACSARPTAARPSPRSTRRRPRASASRWRRIRPTR